MMLNAKIFESVVSDAVAGLYSLFFSNIRSFLHTNIEYKIYLPYSLDSNV